MARLLYFGRLCDATGTDTETRDLPDDVTTTPALRKWLGELHSADDALAENTVRIAINNQIVQEPAPVSNTDEIAFMPPVGGG